MFAWVLHLKATIGYGEVTKSTLSLEMRWKNGEACNWLRKSLTDGLFKILPIGTLEVVFWYVALFAFFTSSGLKGLE